MDLGEYFHCLNVKNIEASIQFYEKLGFQIIEDHRNEKWAMMRHNNMLLSLFEGHIVENLINFRGGDISEIAKALTDKGLSLEKEANQEEDGSWSAELRDPDGNIIYFNTFQDEREQYLRTGKSIDY